MLQFLTLIIMAAIGYAYLREGLFTAFVMCCNVMLAGLVAFNFWEPLADLLDPTFAPSVLHGFEDAVCLILLFSVTLGGLRSVTNLLSRTQVRFPVGLQQGGGAVFGLLTGYLVTGFLTCVLQTLPWHVNFMYFNHRLDAGGESLRHILPGDRVWLALMHRAGAYTFANADDMKTAGKDAPADRYVQKYLTFDKFGTFEQRYARYRRYNDNGEPTKYSGEFGSRGDLMAAE
jgi:hypothetical protein